MEQEKLFIENEIEINASADKVWDALTNPEKTKKYMFGCEVMSDLQPGSPMTWEGEVEGVRMTFVKGHVLNSEPMKELIYTTFDPNSDVPDIPENYLTVTYRLSEKDGKTTLYVSQGDYATVHDGQARYDHAESEGGWSGLILAIKEMLETA